MRYNPCGAAVDWIRYPYTTKARVHNSPDAPLVDLVWYFTDLPFQRHDSVINSLWQSSEDARQVDIGEQWYYPPPYNGLTRIEGLTGEHECGLQSDFEEGQPWPYDGPDIEYDEDGIPFCCPRLRPPQVRGGGIPQAIIEYIPPVFALDCCSSPAHDLAAWYASSLLYAPTLPPQFFRYELPAGGYAVYIDYAGSSLAGEIRVTSGPACGVQTIVQTSGFFTPFSAAFTLTTPSSVCVEVYRFGGGPPNDFRIMLDNFPAPVGVVNVTAGGMPAAQTGGNFIDPTTGGAEGGGDAGDVPSGTDATAGGAEGGGDAGDVPDFTDTPEGGAEGGGDAGDVPSGTDATAGGAEGGGDAGDVQGFTDAADGGGEGGGDAGDIPNFTDATAGGGEGGGTAGDVFLGAEPSVRDSTSGATGTGVYTLPTRVSGDLLVAFIAVAGSAPSVGTGWSNGGIITDPTSGLRFALFRRISNGTDSAPTTNFVASYVIFAVQNATTVDTTANKIGSTAATTLLQTSATPSRVSGNLIAWATATAITSPSYPAGYSMTTELTTTPDIAAGFAVAHSGVPVAPSMTVGSAVNYLGFNLLFH